MSSHFEGGKAVMVDVSGKADTVRVAVAEALVRLPEAALKALQEGVGKGDTGKGDSKGDKGKGDAVAVAELAGIMAAKRTSELVPLCHPLPLTKVAVAGVVEREARRVRFTATCKTTGPTGVEMEALTAVSVACLTLYDMLKGSSKGIIIENIRLLRKEGGKSGLWEASSLQDL